MVQHSLESVFEVLINAGKGGLSITLASRHYESGIGGLSLDVHCVERGQVEEHRTVERWFSSAA